MLLLCIVHDILQALVQMVNKKSNCSCIGRNCSKLVDVNTSNGCKAVGCVHIWGSEPGAGYDLKCCKQCADRGPKGNRMTSTKEFIGNGTTYYKNYAVFGSNKYCGNGNLRYPCCKNSNINKFTRTCSADERGV